MLARKAIAAGCRAQQQRLQHSNTFLRKVVNAKRAREVRIETALDAPQTPPLKYIPTAQPAFVLAQGWAPPPEAPPTDIPFQVPRTGVSAALPVYTTYKNGRTRVMTVVRHVKGDVEEFSEELKKVCNAEVVERRGNSIQVKGNHVKGVQEWLLGLGF
ncbi:mitochondrial large subunit ribosomal protein-domain-containing protein [Tribonema minus]|uniref:Large ribosomal subunit protein mL49 n=1 Tax=Tribonema minus TaxID=303371 RepID=A0A835YTZ2_9STRA|nr:mitochondrial large subunit ribosomal protein-domain-containing protein [Tribonema minus]